MKVYTLIGSNALGDPIQVFVCRRARAEAMQAILRAPGRGMRVLASPERLVASRLALDAGSAGPTEDLFAWSICASLAAHLMHFDESDLIE